MQKIKYLFVLMIISHGLMAQKKHIGELIVNDQEFYNYIDKDAKIEVLGEGFSWSEGPVWVKSLNSLLFSDVPQNTIYKWEEGLELIEFLKPSGYTGLGSYSDERGSNGLIINQEGELVACEHGDRRLSKMPLVKSGGKVTISDNWEGKRFNSPNDVVQAKSGTYFFTDPPYGLLDKENDKSREIPYFGVYKVDKDGKTTLVIKDLTRPNGIAVSPDQKTLYVAQSDPENAIIMAYDLDKEENPINGRVFFDATPMFKSGLKGLPDGLKIDKNGIIFTTGPGGVLIITPHGKLLGRIETGQPTSNCAWGNNGEYLYITANMFLCRIKTKTIGQGF